MIGLVKRKRTGDMQLISRHGEIERQDCGLVIKFPPPDKRKAGYSIPIDRESLVILQDEINKYLEERHNVDNR